jgi:hypothetical protein
MDLFFLYTFFSFVFKDPNIINGDLPSCSRCVHYRDFLSIFVPINNRFSKCSKFGEKNIVTGRINYEYADNVRSDENKCGQSGLFFEPCKFPFSILDKICEDKKK